MPKPIKNVLEEIQNSAGSRFRITQAEYPDRLELWLETKPPGDNWQGVFKITDTSIADDFIQRFRESFQRASRQLSRGIEDDNRYIYEVAYTEYNRRPLSHQFRIVDGRVSPYEYGYNKILENDPNWPPVFIEYNSAAILSEDIERIVQAILTYRDILLMP